MRKIKHYNRDSYQFHKQIVDSLYNGDTKETAMVLDSHIKNAYNNYNNNFNNNNLELLNAINVSQLQKNSLIKLYNSERKAIIELKNELTTNNGRKELLCPLCTINNINTLDHCLPKNIFPEFSINPLNLIPCCSTCNSKKNEQWTTNGTRIFLNLYLDEIPQKQYLFVEFDFNTSIPSTRYFLDNRNGIDSTLYALIESHYNNLNLCHRFTEVTHQELSKLASHIRTYSNLLPKQTLIETIKNLAKDDQKQYGYNYWKSILIIQCCKDQRMYNFLQNWSPNESQ